MEGPGERFITWERQLLYEDMLCSTDLIKLIIINNEMMSLHRLFNREMEIYYRDSDMRLKSLRSNFTYGRKTYRDCVQFRTIWLRDCVSDFQETTSSRNDYPFDRLPVIVSWHVNRQSHKATIPNFRAFTSGETPLKDIHRCCCETHQKIPLRRTVSQEVNKPPVLSSCIPLVPYQTETPRLRDYVQIYI